MSQGMTLKQYARAKFWEALTAYRIALQTGQDIVSASLRVHAALGCDGVPRSYGKLVRQAFKEAS